MDKLFQFVRENMAKPNVSLQEWKTFSALCAQADLKTDWIQDYLNQTIETYGDTYPKEFADDFWWHWDVNKKPYLPPHITHIYWKLENLRNQEAFEFSDFELDFSNVNKLTIGECVTNYSAVWDYYKKLSKFSPNVKTIVLKELGVDFNNWTWSLAKILNLWSQTEEIHIEVSKEPIETWEFLLSKKIWRRAKRKPNLKVHATFCFPETKREGTREIWRETFGKNLGNLDFV